MTEPTEVTPPAEVETPEAEVVEPEEETGDETEGDEPEEPETPEEPEDGAVTDLEAERRLDKLAKRAQSYSKSVVEILGEDLLGLVPCELCGEHWPGLRPPYTRTAPIPAETAGKLRVLIGMPANENFVQDPESNECATCKGLGKVLTGSHVSQFETMQCVTCGGRGFRTTRSTEQTGGDVALTVVGADHTDPEQPEAPEVDPWGRPKGDPDYFRMPGYEQAV